VVEVELQETIRCSAQTWLEFVLAVDRYREVDNKIGPIPWSSRVGNLVEFKFRPRLPGVRLPPSYIVSQMRLTPWQSIDVALAPLPRNLISRPALQFSAQFSCTPCNDGINVTRSVCFAFTPGLSWYTDPILRRTLPVSVRRELDLTKALLEGETSAGAG